MFDPLQVPYFLCIMCLHSLIWFKSSFKPILNISSKSPSVFPLLSVPRLVLTSLCPFHPKHFSLRFISSFSSSYLLFPLCLAFPAVFLQRWLSWFQSQKSVVRKPTPVLLLNGCLRKAHIYVLISGCDGDLPSTDKHGTLKPGPGPVPNKNHWQWLTCALL